MKPSFVIVALCVLLGPVLPLSADDTTEADFAHDVVPILRQHCVECHGGDEAEGGMSLNTRSTLLDAEAVVPGQAEQSMLIKLVTSTDPVEQMPPKDRPRLTDAEITTLRNWIDAGASWEEGFTFAEDRYESPLHPRKVELPPARDGRTNPVDRILDAYFAEHNVQPGPPLNDQAFMRRLSLDITGLLPKPDELQQFLADGSSNKRERLIERTLGDDRAFAEHWLTFWSDLLRNTYAGTGFIDDGRRQITEWLYGALLTNKPYDQFVRELLAPEPQAAGFIRGIKWRGNVNSSQATEIQFAQSIGQVFLGINLKCASCHDSFIDRWTLDDTYNLAAIYATAPLEVHRCDVPTGRFAEPAWLYPELGQIDPAAEQPERLRQMAELMTDPENGRLARTIVNRIWQRLMGRGIVHPVDAMQTRPWSEDLIDFLAWDLREHGYDLKRTMALIAGSHAYQSEAAPLAAPASAEDYVFRGPLTKRMTAEQFFDALHGISDTWPGPDSRAFRRDGRGQGGQLAAVVRAEERAESRIPLEELVTGSLVRTALEQALWVWNDADALTAAPRATAHFRKTFSVDDAEHVLILLNADHAATLFLNGKQLAGHKGPGSVLVAEATHHLQPEANVIAVRVENDGKENANPAGLLLTVIGVSGEGALLWANPADGTWRATAEAPDGWQRSDFDDSSWTAASVIGGADADPWNLLEKFDDGKFTLQRDWGSHWKNHPVRASLAPPSGLEATLGRPNREQVVTSRPSQLTTLEAISLSNGEEMSRMLSEAAKRILATHAKSPAALTDWLYWSALSRPPTATEAAVAGELLGSPVTPEGVEDLLWTVLMLPEFQLIR